METWGKLDLGLQRVCVLPTHFKCVGLKLPKK